MFMVVCAVDRILVISVMVPSIKLRGLSPNRRVPDFDRVISSGFIVATMFFSTKSGDAAA